MDLAIDARRMARKVLAASSSMSLDALYVALRSVSRQATGFAQQAYLSQAASSACSMFDNLLWAVAHNSRPSSIAGPATHSLSDSVDLTFKKLKGMLNVDFVMPDTFMNGERRVIARVDFQGETTVASCAVTLMGGTPFILQHVADLLVADPRADTLSQQPEPPQGFYKDSGRHTLVVEILPANLRFELTPELLSAAQPSHAERVSDMARITRAYSPRLDVLADEDEPQSALPLDPGSPAALLPECYPPEAFERPEDFFIAWCRDHIDRAKGRQLVADLVALGYIPSLVRDARTDQATA